MQTIPFASSNVAQRSGQQRHMPAAVSTFEEKRLARSIGRQYARADAIGRWKPSIDWRVRQELGWTIAHERKNRALRVDLTQPGFHRAIRRCWWADSRRQHTRVF